MVQNMFAKDVSLLIPKSDQKKVFPPKNGIGNTFSKQIPRDLSVWFSIYLPTCSTGFSTGKIPQQKIHSEMASDGITIYP